MILKAITYLAVSLVICWLTRGSYILLSTCLHIVYFHMNMQNFNCISGTYSLSPVFQKKEGTQNAINLLHFIYEISCFCNWDTFRIIYIYKTLKWNNLSLPWLGFAIISMKKCLVKKKKKKINLQWLGLVSKFLHWVNKLWRGFWKKSFQIW